jgi:hypothetical protein
MLGEVMAMDNSNISQELKKYGEEFMCDVIDCFSLNPTAIIKTINKVANAPFILQQYCFWNKFERFVRGVRIDEDFSIKFATKITNSDKRDYYAKRIVETIDKIDDDEKVDLIINATRALCWERISDEEYFRICSIIRRCYIADLNFIKSEYPNWGHSGDVHVVELVSNGLMIKTIFAGGSWGEQNDIIPDCQFTQLATLIYDNCLNYEKPIPELY